MCGIVGYVGTKQAAPILLDGLSKLEYRGYDSAGVAIMTDEGIVVKKKKGRLEKLSNMIDGGGRNKRHYGNWSYKVGNSWRAVGYELASASQPVG